MIGAELQNPAERLAAIIAAGVARFESTLPAYAQRSDEAEAPETRTHISVSEERQIELCLNCPLAECAGIASRDCPIRRESLRVWRERRTNPAT
ncbi:MAG TPA: hypothetical protein VJ810_23650 [Blastocatellia bacterium]|nr:hypothetical protein [Blastocatellia bacterium]